MSFQKPIGVITFLAILLISAVIKYFLLKKK